MRRTPACRAILTKGSQGFGFGQEYTDFTGLWLAFMRGLYRGVARYSGFLAQSFR